VTGAEVLGAISWDPTVKGGLYVLLAVLILCGSAYLLLSTNLGSRLGFQLAAAGLFGFMVIIGFVWWIYGIGPQGPAPSWQPKFTVTGDLARTESETLAGFPRGWRELGLDDADVADAQAVVDADLTAEDGLFTSASDYLPVAAYEKGGETYSVLPFLNFRPFNLWHKPHYLVVQVQPVLKQEAPPGGAPPRPEVDPAQPRVAVVMVRDLGALRRNPAVATISSLLIFGLLVYQLHTRDKEAMAKRA
jgi:hypothetical protein